MSLYDDIQKDVKLEEDGRYGYNYETRKQYKETGPKIGPNYCKWCGRHLHGAIEYHISCLEVKQRLEAY